MRTRHQVRSSVTQVRCTGRLRRRGRLGERTGTSSRLTNLPSSMQLTHLRGAFNIFTSTVIKRRNSAILRGRLVRIHLTGGKKHVKCIHLGGCSGCGNRPLILFSRGSSGFSFALIATSGHIMGANSLCFAPMGKGSQGDVAVHLGANRNDRLSFVCALGPSSCVLRFSVGKANLGNMLSPNAATLSLL